MSTSLENFQPPEEEIKKAEEIMTERQKEATRRREEVQTLDDKSLLERVVEVGESKDRDEDYIDILRKEAARRMEKKRKSE
ncbi:MAG: hypothetical protein AAB482_01990 [Patescibacteria group bacterium]|mgnify:CR=1 FL=1